MAPPIYFFPRVTLAQLAHQDRLSQAVLSARGLDRTFADIESVRRETSLFELRGLGPGGCSGCLLTALPPGGETPVRLTYEPALQDWQECGEVWVGLDKEHSITPKDLERKDVLPGYEIELGGQQWQVPVIRDPEGGTGLPQDWDVGPGGNITQTIQATYRHLWDEFAEVLDLFFSPADPSPAGVFKLPVDRAWELCRDVLGLNYRFDRIEQNILHLVGPQTWTTILGAAVDMPTFRDVMAAVQEQKKTRDTPEPEPESTSILPGSEDSAPDTDPVEPSCDLPPS